MTVSGNRQPGLLRAWFFLTPQEQRLLMGILALALIGLTARHWQLRRRVPVPVPAPEMAVPLAEENSP